MIYVFGYLCIVLQSERERERDKKVASITTTQCQRKKLSAKLQNETMLKYRPNHSLFLVDLVPHRRVASMFHSYSHINKQYQHVFVFITHIIMHNCKERCLRKRESWWLCRLSERETCRNALKPCASCPISIVNSVNALKSDYLLIASNKITYTIRSGKMKWGCQKKKKKKKYMHAYIHVWI